MAIASIDPATGEKLKEFSPFDGAEIEKRLSRAEKAFRNYRRTTLADRAELLHAASDLLFQEKQAFAELITLEMGKLFRDSLAEIEKCARGCRFYAENGARFLEEEPAQTEAAESYVQYQPLGPVLAIMLSKISSPSWRKNSRRRLEHRLPACAAKRHLACSIPAARHPERSRGIPARYSPVALRGSSTPLRAALNDPALALL